VQPEPPKKAHADAERRRKQLNPVRIQQHTALLLMRQLQWCEFDDDTNPAICSMNLQDGEFVELTAAEHKRLTNATAVLRLMLQEKNATDAKIRSALSDTQYAEYKDSFNLYVTHVEEDWEHRPNELDEYIRLVKLGDFFNGAADRVAKRAAVSKHGTRYDSQGRPTSVRLRDKAESFYEEALMYLRGECEDLGKAGMLQRWFDRELEFDLTKTTLSTDVVGIPRLRGSRSAHCLDKSRNIWGAQKSKHYRQRDAVTESVFELLFDERERELQIHLLGDFARAMFEKHANKIRNADPNTPVRSEKLQRLLRKGLDDDEDEW